MTILETLDTIERSLDILLQESTIDQAATWIQRAAMNDKDIDKLLRWRSFVNFDSLTDSEGRAIANQDDLEQALTDISATPLVRQAMISAWEDYTQYHYNGSGIINPKSANYAGRALQLST